MGQKAGMNKVLFFFAAVCLSVVRGQDGLDLRAEKLDFARIWGTTDAHPGLNSDIARNMQLASWGEDDFFVVYVDTGRRPKVAHIQRDSKDGTWLEVSNVPVVDDAAFVTRNSKNNLYSIGIDENGYLHVAGDMNEYPFYSSRQSHLPVEYREKYCLMWISAAPAQATVFRFRGEVEETCIRGTGFKHLKFINDNNGKLFAHYRAIGIPPAGKKGYRVFAMSRFNTVTDEWEGIGADMGEGLLALAYERSVPDESPNYNQHRGQVNFDASNRMHMAILMPGEDGAGKQSTHIIYASSIDEGVSWQRGDMSMVDLPMRIRTEGNDRADVVYTGAELEEWVAVGAIYARFPWVVFADRSLEDKLVSVWSDRTMWLPGAFPPSRYYSSLGVGAYVSHDSLGVLTLTSTKEQIYRFQLPDNRVAHDVGWKRLMIDQPYMRRTGMIAGLSQIRAGSTTRGEVDLVLSSPPYSDTDPTDPPVDTCHLGHLEAVFVLDLSWSAGPRLEIIKSAVPAAATGVAAKYRSAKFALASYTDKPVPPLGHFVSLDYCYWLHMGLGDQSDFDSQLGSTFTRSGNDWDEDPLDACHQAAVDPRVGWTTTATDPDGLPVSQVMVVISDGGVHYEGDGLPHGLVEHDGRDVLHCKTMDYPAVSTVAAAILGAGSGNVKVVFLVSESAAPDYEDLAVELEDHGIFATVVVPSTDDAVGIEEAALQAMDVCEAPTRRLKSDINRHPSVGRPRPPPALIPADAHPTVGPHERPRQPPALIPPDAFDPCVNE